MAPLILHGVKQSTCTQRVLTTLAEVNQPFEMDTIKMAQGQHKSPEYLKMQPFGKIPVLEDDGLLIYESRAIAKYLASKYGNGKLCPSPADDAGKFAIFEQACSLEAFYFNPPAEGLAFEKVFKGYFKLGDPDEAKVAEYTAKLDGVLKVYDGILAKQKYLAGDEVTLADLFHLPYGSMVKGVGFDVVFAKYPNVDKWFSGLQERGSWKAATS